MKYIQVLLLLLISAGIVVAEDGDALQIRHSFRHLTIEDGLSQSSVNCLLQDRYGFVWLGTQDGLNLYDGHEFKVWKTDATDVLTIADPYITCLAEDADGNLWVGSESSGFAHFDREAWGFDFLSVGPDESRASYEVQALILGPQGKVWVGTRSHGLLCHDPTSGTTRVVDLGYTEITSLLFDEDENFWVGTDEGLVKLEVEHLSYPSPAHYLLGRRINTLATTSEGSLWVGHDQGLNQYDTEQDVFTARLADVDFGPEGVSSLAEDTLDHLWIGSISQGIYRYQLETGEYLLLEKDETSATCLQDDLIACLMVDTAGVLWAGHSLGSSLLDSFAKEFYHFRHQVNDPNSLSDNSVWSFFEDPDGKVWIGTNHGLNHFDPATGDFTIYPPDPDDPTRPSSPRLTNVFRDSRGYLWMGQSQGALNRRDPITGIFTRYQDDPTGLAGPASTRVYAASEDHRGIIWLASANGLQIYDPATDRFETLGGLYDLSGHMCKNMLHEDNGAVWAGTWGDGLVRIDPNLGQRQHYRHDPKNRATLSSDTIMALLRDRRGRIWVATSSGLNRLDTATGLVTRFTEKEGLPNNTIYGLAEDGEGFIWASSNFGLVRLNPDDLSLTHFQQRDGLQSNEFNMGAVSFGPSGRMYFGGINGFSVFYPEKIKANPYIPPVVITEFQINNEIVRPGVENRGRILLDEPIHLAERLDLDHRDHVLSFSFSALHFAAPGKNLYTYMLEGFDEDWNEADSRSHITYTNLPPGHYTFRVLGSNSDGVWNEAGASMVIDIKPPFWQTPWFLTLLVVLGLTSVNGIIRYRTRLMKVRTNDLEKRVTRRTGDLTRANHFLQQEITERRRVEEALRVAKDEAEAATQAKSEFLANMSHEIRTPMNGVLGMTSVLLEDDLSSEHREHLEVVYASARNLLGVINDILDFSKIEAGKLELETIDFELRDLVEEVGDMLSTKAHDKGLLFSLCVDHQLPTSLRGDPVRVRQILVNLLNNAIKFTSEGSVSVRVSSNQRVDGKEGLHFEVKDSGVGIPADRMDCLFDSFSQVDTSTTRQYGGTGLGLAISKQLVDLMDGEIGVESEPGEGTTFWFDLSFPLALAPTPVPSKLETQVLVLLPEPNMRQAAVEMLQFLGCIPLAPDYHGDPGKTVLDAFSPGHEIQLVLTDQDAVNVPRKLFDGLGDAAPPCLAIVNMGTSRDLNQLQASGFMDCVWGPMRAFKLRESLIAALDGQSKPMIAPVEEQVPDRVATSARPIEEEDDHDHRLPLLLAEDNPVNQKVASILLRKQGYKVEVVDNGAEALEALARQRYALVFMDVQMPVMDGYEAVRRIRAGESDILDPQVPIIALTAHAMKGDRQRCLDAGMDDYLAKPIDQKALVALLDHYLPLTV